ncbi:MAG: archaetidylserine decarboxylase [Gammaproteobacteria bacterium]|nr:archaetidylserine decarboxylase [Gammaproteobacteria bacterium]
MNHQLPFGIPKPDAKLTDYVKALPQYLLPHHLLSRGMHWLARQETPWLKNLIIRFIYKKFDIDTSTAEIENPLEYRSFNHFFTRSLRPDARPISTDRQLLVSPVDGTVSQAGLIGEHAQPGSLPIQDIFQAKGRYFSLDELLGGDRQRAMPFVGGHFATIYLSPKDYHRIHIPVDATLKEMVHIPGRLFSVNPATTRAVPRLFARNERVACIFDTAHGPMAIVMVGAIFVSSIETVWAGEVTPPSRSKVRSWHYLAKQHQFAKGAEIGRFNMGSTVVVLFGPNMVNWTKDITAEHVIRMGEPLAEFNPKLLND